MSQPRFRVLILGVLVILFSGLIGTARIGWTLLGLDPPEWAERINHGYRVPSDDQGVSPLALVGFGIGVVLIGGAVWPRRRRPLPPENDS